jgi:hypothetical protein
MKRDFAVRKRQLIVFVILTALGIAVYKIGADYLQSPHSEVLKFEIKPSVRPPVPTVPRGDEIMRSVLAI